MSLMEMQWMRFVLSMDVLGLQMAFVQHYPSKIEEEFIDGAGNFAKKFLGLF
jgi:hypothetical protein